IWRRCGGSGSPNCAPIRSSRSAGAWVAKAAWQPSCGRMAYRQACRPSIEPRNSRRAPGRAPSAVAWPFAVLALASLLLYPGYAMQRENLKLLTAHGTRVIDVEIADTPQEKAQGLMFRTHLDDHRGMLFAYDTPQEITMWMRNTYIPLDMVFIR